MNFFPKTCFKFISSFSNLTTHQITWIFHNSLASLSYLDSTVNLFDCETNSPFCQHLKKYIENSMENMNSDVKV